MYNCSGCSYSSIFSFFFYVGCHGAAVDFVSLNIFRELRCPRLTDVCMAQVARYKLFYGFKWYAWDWRAKHRKIDLLLHDRLSPFTYLGTWDSSKGRHVPSMLFRRLDSHESLAHDLASRFTWR